MRLHMLAIVWGGLTPTEGYVRSPIVSRIVGDGSRGDYRGAFEDLLSPRDGFSLDVAAGDVDGDGDIDLVVANLSRGDTTSGQNRLYLNDGFGRMTDVTDDHLPMFSDWSFNVALADFDGDGDLDMIVGNGTGYGEFRRNRLLLNDGSGHFTDVTEGPPRRLPPSGDYANSELSPGDIDADGDVDIIVTSGGTDSQVLVNRGDAFFVDQVASRLTSTTVDQGTWRCAEMGDVDGDGDLDYVRAGLNQPQLFINDGTGHFVDRANGPVAGLPASLDAEVNPIDCEFGDLDGDGDLDLVIVSTAILGGSPDPRSDDRLLLNDGNGFFTDGTFGPDTGLPQLFEMGFSVALGDVDRDGDLDVITGNGASSRDRLYLNDGAARFTDATLGFATGLPDEPAPSMEVVLEDMDGDGDLDLVMARFGDAGKPNIVFFNE